MHYTSEFYCRFQIIAASKYGCLWFTYGKKVEYQKFKSVEMWHLIVLTLHYWLTFINLQICFKVFLNVIATVYIQDKVGHKKVHFKINF